MAKIYLSKYNEKSCFILPQKISTAGEFIFLEEYNTKFICENDENIRDVNDAFYYFYIVVYTQNDFTKWETDHKLHQKSYRSKKNQSNYLNDWQQLFCQYLLMKNNDLTKYKILSALIETEKTFPDYYIISNFTSEISIVAKSKSNVSYSIIEDLKKIGVDIDKKDLPLLPIVHVSNYDLLNEELLPRHKNIIDSSIWNYFFHKKKDNLDDLHEIIRKIIINWKSGLYFTSNALEVADFRARQTLISFLAKYDMGHGEYIKPFIFHSESAMSKSILYEIGRLDEHENEIEWRFLLVDDNAFKRKSSIKPKCEIIVDRLKNFFNIQCESRCEGCKLNFEENEAEKSKYCRFKIKINCAGSNIEAINEIKNKRYDIILLDYLLGGNDGNNESREYSYELLEYLKVILNPKLTISDKTKKIRYSFPRILLDLKRHGNQENDEEIIRQEVVLLEKSKGIYGKFWFFFISAFTTAVNERLLEKGMAYDTGDWVINRGACPTTTPELFRYNLLNFMNRQIEIITELSISNQAHEKLDDKQEKSANKNKIISLLDLLYFIYKEHQNAREYSGLFFNALLNLRANYDILKYDTCQNIEKTNGSPLVNSLFPDIEHYENAFWEHLTHLVYLTAYGTVLDWLEMWQEFRFVKLNLVAAEKKIVHGKNVSNLMECYIISLKNSSES